MLLARMTAKRCVRGLPSKMSAQAMVEFLVVIPVFLLLIFGAVQIGFIYSAKTTLNYATFQAARLGAVNHATYSSMRRGLIRGLAPLFTNSPALSSLEDSVNEGIDSGGTRRDSVTEVDGYTRIIRISPTYAQIEESGFGVENADGILEIPNDNLMYRPSRKVDGATIQDANLLKIRVQYCYKLMVPLVNRVIGNLSELNNQRTNQEIYETVNDPRFADANRYYVDASSGISADYDGLCGDRADNSEGFIIFSEAIVRMQSTAYAEDDDTDFESVMCDGVRMACP